VESDGVLHSNVSNYETLVISDDDIPNKKYVDDNFVANTGNETVAGIKTYSSNGIFQANLTVSGSLFANGGIDMVGQTITNLIALTFEGTITDDYETIVVIENPDVDRTVIIPNADGYFVTNTNKCTNIEGSNLTVNSGTLDLDSDIAIDSITTNWTNAGNIIADLGTISDCQYLAVDNIILNGNDIAIGDGSSSAVRSLNITTDNSVIEGNVRIITMIRSGSILGYFALAHEGICIGLGGSGISTNATALAQSDIFISNAGLVGIGLANTSPETILDVSYTSPYLTLHNTTEEDTDGGRESQIIFKGKQSGGELTTLAKIEAYHDGASDDQKGKVIISTNDGTDGNSPTERVSIDSAGLVNITGDLAVSGATMKVGTFTGRTSAGSKAVTGVGFQPKLIKVVLLHPDNGIRAIKGEGYCDEDLNQWANYIDTNDTSSSLTQVVYWKDNTSAIQEAGAVTSLDSDGFTINFTTANGTTYTYGYVAWKL